MKIRNGRPFLFLLLSIGCLCALREIPAFSVCGFEIRRIDLLSDLLGADSSAFGMQDLNLIDKRLLPPEEESCPEGMTCIVDFGQDSPSGMQSFYKALADRDQLGRPVHIAYFGDSFVEGDILTADLRDLLQQQFGGCGAGYLDIAPESPGFRTSVVQRYGGWDPHTILSKNGFVSQKMGINLHYAMGDSGDWTEIAGSKKYACSGHFEQSTFFLASSSPVTLCAERNDGKSESFTSKGDGTLEAITTRGELNKVKWTIRSGENVLCYGVTAEGQSGISLDNFSQRSISGAQIAQIPSNFLASLQRLRPYDLIVLHYGLNVAETKRTNYEAYIQQMKAVIRHLREAYPETSILVVSVGDRETRINGELHTMPGVLALIQYQEKLAAESGVAFWNLYEAMGGDGSIVHMSRLSPEEARKDYTHITRPGGKRLGALLCKSLVYGYDKYKKRMGK